MSWSIKIFPTAIYGIYGFQLKCYKRFAAIPAYYIKIIDFNSSRKVDKYLGQCSSRSTCFNLKTKGSTGVLKKCCIVGKKRKKSNKNNNKWLERQRKKLKAVLRIMCSG